MIIQFIKFIEQKSILCDLWEIGVFILCLSLVPVVVLFFFERLHFLFKNLKKVTAMEAVKKIMYKYEVKITYRTKGRGYKRILVTSLFATNESILSIMVGKKLKMKENFTYDILTQNEVSI